MVRKTIDIQVEDDNRDKGKTFRITEKDIYSAEFWAMRAFGGMLNAGVNIPDMSRVSMEMLYHYGLAAFMKIEPFLLKELLDEMMECVSVVPQPTTEPGVTRKVLSSDIEELTTLFMLRKKALGLHIDPFMEGVSQSTD